MSILFLSRKRLISIGYVIGSVRHELAHVPWIVSRLSRYHVSWFVVTTKFGIHHRFDEPGVELVL